jgi:probable addiction module antidote protein
MTTVFVGGSRQVSRLPSVATERLKKILDSRLQVIVGDANGADKAAQKYMADAGYDAVTVYCSGEQPRNNVGHWTVSSVIPSESAKGFQFYAAKDREMAVKADYGLMIWDGKSPGTLLNVLRLVHAGKIAVLVNVPAKNHLTFRSGTDWQKFLDRCNVELVEDLRQRATPDEWLPPVETKPAKADGRQEIQLRQNAESFDESLTANINAAFAKGDMAAVVDLIGSFAKSRGMSSVSDQTGLARESLYRSLSADGNPEFSTILKVLGSLGLQLSVTKVKVTKTMQATT